MSMTWHDLKLRLGALLRLKQAEADLDEEMRFHLEMETRKNVQAGLPVSEAQRRARMNFGGLDQHKEECRGARGTEFVESTLRDIRYALRGFLRTPAFALTVIGTIGLALGLNTAVFTIFNAYVLRPLAVRDPNSLYEFMWTNREGRRYSFTWQQFQEFQSANSVFTETIGTTSTLITRVDRRVMAGGLVTGNYFSMLGVHPTLGRTLLPEDCCASGRHPVIVLSHATWQNMYGGDPQIIGRKLLIRGYPLEVIGVMQPGFSGLGEVPTDFWAPLSMAPQLQDGSDLFGPQRPRGLHIIGRIKPKLALSHGEAMLLSWANAQTESLPGKDKAVRAILYPHATRFPLSWEMIAAVSPVIVAFGLILVIACANVANMMLSRMLSRRREIGIRLSLGAARFRLIRQLLTECLILAGFAAVAGLILSQLAMRYGQDMILRALPQEMMEFVRIDPLNADLRVFFFMVLAAGASTLVFGLAPALQVTRASLVSATRGDLSNDHRPERLRAWLIVSQVTCCVLLLITSGVLLRTVTRVQRIDTGVQADRIVVLEVQDSSRAKIIELLRSDPTVHSVAGAASIPTNASLASTRMTPLPGNSPTHVAYNLVSEEYLSMLDVPVLKGRNFTSGEVRASAPVAILSSSTAERMFPGEDPLGRMIQVGDRNDPNRNKQLDPYSTVRVVGIARDVACASLHATRASPCVYLPASPLTSGTSIFVKVNQETEQARQHLDSMLSTHAPGAVQQIVKLNTFLAVNIYPFLAASWVCTAIGLLALLLTITGVYGVLSYLVAQRSREIGIRVALGATSLSVIAMVLKQSVRFSLKGALAGAILALVISRLLSSRLHVVDPFDAPAYFIGAFTVIAAACAAAYFPSRRAAMLDPSTTLRCD